MLFLSSSGGLRSGTTHTSPPAFSVSSQAPRSTNTGDSSSGVLPTRPQHVQPSFWFVKNCCRTLPTLSARLIMDT